MACWKSAWILVVVAVISTLLSSIHATEIGGRVGRRILLSFKETPRGSNFTFDCSPSGPCVPCAYSEKSDENYRCSETCYRIPFKCIEIEHDTKNENGKQHSQNGRSAAEISDNLNPNISLQDAASNEGRILLNGSSSAKDGAQIYITYRSCIAANAEKLSVLDFEVRRTDVPTMFREHVPLRRRMLCPSMVETCRPPCHLMHLHLLCFLVRLVLASSGW